MTLPLLLLVVFGIIDFGFMFQRYEVVTNAAREGARLGVLQGLGRLHGNRSAEPRAGLPAAPAASTDHPARCGTAPMVKNTMCAVMTTSTVTVAGSTPAKTVDQVTMIVEYDHEYSFVGPIMNLFGGGAGKHPAQIRQHRCAVSKPRALRRRE